MIPSNGRDTFFYRRISPNWADEVEIVSGQVLSSPFYAETFSKLPFFEKIKIIEEVLSVEIDLRSVWCGLHKQPNWNATHLTRAWSLVPDLVCDNSWAWRELAEGRFELHLTYTLHQNDSTGAKRDMVVPLVMAGPTLAHCYIEAILVALARTHL